MQNKDVPLEIYQAEIADISTKISSPPVGIEDILLSEIKDIEIYPNPIDAEMIFSIPAPLTQSYQWKLIDQRGVFLLEGELVFRNNNFRVNTTSVPNGIYFIVITSRDKPLIYKKLAVMHR